MDESNSKNERMHRVNTRIFEHQNQFIKDQVKKSRGNTSEGDIHRELLDLGIKAYKAKK